MRAIARIYHPELCAQLVHLAYHHAVTSPRAVTTRYDETTGERKRLFTMGDGTNFVTVGLVDGRGRPAHCELTLTNGPDEAACQLVAGSNYVHSKSVLQENLLSAAQTAAHHLENGFLLYKLEMPYGYVNKQNVINLILWSNFERDPVTGTVHIAQGHYLRRGYVVPEVLRLQDGDGRGYMDRFWQLLSQVSGPRLVELSDRRSYLMKRIMKPDGPPKHLVFLREGNSWPAFVYGVPYYLGHPATPATNKQGSRAR